MYTMLYSTADNKMLLLWCFVLAVSPDDLIQYTAITWLKEFVILSGRTMLPHMAGILNAILPCLSYTDEARKKWVCDVANGYL